jgi:hypothetical protein
LTFLRFFGLFVEPSVPDDGVPFAGGLLFGALDLSVSLP